MKTMYRIINLILLSLTFTVGLEAIPNTDLLEAAANSDLPKLESALTAGADVNYADSENRTALYFAYEKENTEIISYLKQNGARETNLTKLFRMEKNCQKEWAKQNYKGVITEADAIQKEKIQYDTLFKKEDKTLSLEQNTFLNLISYRASAYTNLKEFKLAILEYEFIIQKIKVPNVYVYLYYANALKESGDVKKTIQVLENSLLLYKEKDKARIYDSLGWYYYLENQIDKAIQSGEEGFKLVKDDINYIGAYFNISLYYFANEKTEKAFEWLFYSLNIGFRLEQDKMNSAFSPTLKDLNDLKQSAIYPHISKKEINAAILMLEVAMNVDNKKFPVPIFLNLETYLEKLNEPNSKLYYIFAAYSSLQNNWMQTEFFLDLLSSKDNSLSLLEKSKKEQAFEGYYNRPRLIVNSGHSLPITKIVYSPDGKYIVTAAADKTIKIWANTGKLLKTIYVNSSIGHLKISPDSKHILYSSGNNLDLIDFDGINIASTNTKYITDIDFHPSKNEFVL